MVCSLHLGLVRQRYTLLNILHIQNSLDSNPPLQLSTTSHQRIEFVQYAMKAQEKKLVGKPQVDHFAKIRFTRSRKNIHTQIITGKIFIISTIAGWHFFFFN